MDRNTFSQGESLAEFMRSFNPEQKEKLDQLQDEVNLNADQLDRLAGLPSDLHVLVIAEDWSGDVLYFLPVLARLADQAGWEVRVFRRDRYPEMIEPYKKEGIYRSIPVFVFYDQDFNEIGNWVERPAAATRVIDEESLKLRRRLREEHKVDWRNEAVRELIDLVKPKG